MPINLTFFQITLHQKILVLFTILVCCVKCQKDKKKDLYKINFDLKYLKCYLSLELFIVLPKELDAS